MISGTTVACCTFSFGATSRCAISKPRSASLGSSSAAADDGGIHYFFGRLAKIPSNGVPYPLFAFAGLLPWQLFAFSISEAANSLVASQNLIKKVYFPRLVIPFGTVLAGLLDFAVGFVCSWR